MVSELFILSLHQLISKGIDDKRYKPGEYRDNPKGNITRVGDSDHGGVINHRKHILILSFSWVTLLSGLIVRKY